MKRFALRGAIGAFVILAATVTAHATLNNPSLSFHIPALEGEADVVTAYVQLNWTDGTHSTYALPTHRVDPVGMLVASNAVPPMPNRVLASVYVYGNMLGGGTYSRSATAKVNAGSLYDLLVSGVYQGTIQIDVD